jgi:tetratricopeptide (TPR) repeat protein
VEESPNPNKERSEDKLTGHRQNGGASTEQTQPIDTQARTDQDPEFVVTEKEVDDLAEEQKTSSKRANELGIQSTSDLMEQEAASNRRDEPAWPTSAHHGSPIGESAPPLPPQAMSSDSSGQESPVANSEDLGSKPSEDTTSEIRKLTPEEVAEIEKELYKNSSHLKHRQTRPKSPVPSERPEVAIDAGKLPVEPAGDLPRPKMAQRERGLAYFYKNYVQLVGRQTLYPNDELYVNGRCYDLKPKRFGNKTLVAAGTILLAAVLFFAATQFMTGTPSREGEIIGVVLGDTGQPFVQRATIRFPDLGRHTNSTPQGFFRSGPVSDGTHKIEYLVGGQLIGVDYATVAGGKITLLSIKPGKDLLTQAKAPQRRSQAAVTPPPQREPEREQKRPEPPAQAKASRSSSKSAPRTASKKPVTSGPAKITLAANVEGARLALNGNVLGAGNLTYSRIKPGTYKYSVSKDGFQTAAGSVKLAPGESRKLSVELAPLAQQAKAEVYTAEDFYYSGLTAVDNGDVETALSDLSEAIEREPSYGAAYQARADAYTRIGQKEQAYADYVRAAEIFQIRGNYNSAVTAFGKAVQLDEKKITAYLGRANTYLAKKEELAAIADYQAAVDLDNRNTKAHFGLGEARFRQGQYKTACQHFKDARSLDSNNPLVYQYLMLCYLALDDIKRVKKSYEQFEDVATKEQMSRLHNDSQFSAVLRVVKSD